MPHASPGTHVSPPKPESDYTTQAHTNPSPPTRYVCSCVCVCQFPIMQRHTGSIQPCQQTDGAAVPFVLRHSLSPLCERSNRFAIVLQDVQHTRTVHSRTWHTSDGEASSKNDKEIAHVVPIGKLQPIPVNEQQLRWRGRASLHTGEHSVDVRICKQHVSYYPGLCRQAVPVLPAVKCVYYLHKVCVPYDKTLT